MAVESYLLGRKAAAYYNTLETLITDPGSGEPKEWVETWLDLNGTPTDSYTQVAGNLTDVSLNISSEFADGTTRATAVTGFASQIPVLRGGEVTFEARWLPADPDIGAQLPFTTVLTNAWENDGRIAMVFLDRPWALDSVETGEKFICQGLAANWSVSLDKTEALRDVQRMSVTLTIADTALWFTSDARTGA